MVRDQFSRTITQPSTNLKGLVPSQATKHSLFNQDNKNKTFTNTRKETH